MSTVSDPPATQQLLIGGRWRDAEAGRTHDVIGVGEQPVTRQAAASAADARAAADAAAAALPAWSATAPEERRDLLTRAGELLGSRAEEIAATMAQETGGTFGWGMFNVGLAADILTAAGALATEPVAEAVASRVPGLRSQAVRRPLGVCVGIAPWNAPVILGTRAVAWPLAFGNTVVMKASEQSPRTHAAIVQALLDAGLPDGAVNLITNDPADAGAVVDALIEHPAVRHVNFTGSTRVGRLIAQKAAGELKRTLLELGGKAPLVVLDDADLDAAAAAASFGAFMNAGQICMSTERVVIDERALDEFAKRIATRAEELSVGDPSDPATQVGPVVNEAALRHVRELIDDAVANGAQVLAGGTHDGLLHRPTVIAGVTPQMRIYAEESFGPLLAIVAADGEEDAIRIANDTAYGLSSAVFSGDPERGLRVAAQIESGICHVNGSTVHDEAPAPFGGVKASGWGRFGAGQVAAEFTDTRWITVSEEERHYPI